MTPLPRLEIETHGFTFGHADLVRGLERLEHRGLSLPDIASALQVDPDWAVLAIGMAGICKAEDHWDAAAEIRGILAERKGKLPWWAEP